MNVRTATALLVDDDEASVQSTRQRLEGDGYTVLLARDGSEGLARAKQSLPDVIFTHLVAAGHSNVAFIQALRSDDSCRHVPVMIVTGRQDPRSVQKKLRPVSRDRW